MNFDTYAQIVEFQEIRKRISIQKMGYATIIRTTVNGTEVKERKEHEDAING